MEDDAAKRIRDIPAGTDPGTGGPASGETELDKIVAELGFFAVAQQAGFALEPSKSDFENFLREVLTQGETFTSELARVSQRAEDPNLAYAIRAQFQGEQQALEREQAEFWGKYSPIVDSFRGRFGIGMGGKAEAPGDPLAEYFRAFDRMEAEVLGPSPESRFINAPSVGEAIESTTPTDFQQFLQQQGDELQARYLAEVFEQFAPQLKGIGRELAGLPQSDGAGGFPRLERFLGLREELGLDQIPTYEDFIAEKAPELQARFKYIRPLSDEESTAAFRTVFGAEIGEKGGELTRFGQFALQQAEALGVEFSDVIREQLRGGAGIEDVGSFEEFLGEQMPELQRTYKIHDPLGDEDASAVFREAFKDEGSAFGGYARSQQEATETKFEDFTRTMLREGGAMEDVVSYEEFLGGYTRGGEAFGGERGALEKSFRLTRPGARRKPAGGLGRPTRKL